MNLLILGDPHIGKNAGLNKASLGFNLNGRISDQLNILDWTLDRAIEYHADIVLTGDVFEDPKPASYLIVLLMNWLKKCQINHVKVHIIRGNHDFLRTGQYSNSPLDIIAEAEIDGIFIYKDINTIYINSTAFTFVPFYDRKTFNSNSNNEALSLLQNQLNYEFISIPQTYHKVLIGHLALEGAIPVGDEIDDLANELICPLDMFKNYHHVWMGHVHKPQILLENPHIAHIGSMDISNFGETDHKKHIIIFDCQNNTWKSENIPTRPLQKITISIPKDIDKNTTDYVLDELKSINIQDKSILKLDITLSAPELLSVDKVVIENFLMQQGISSISSISETRKLNLIKKDINNSLDTKMDVSSAIKTYANLYINQENRSKFIEISMEIYNSYKNEEFN